MIQILVPPSAKTALILFSLSFISHLTEAMSRALIRKCPKCSEPYIKEPDSLVVRSFLSKFHSDLARFLAVATKSSALRAERSPATCKCRALSLLLQSLCQLTSLSSHCHPSPTLSHSLASSNLSYCDRYSCGKIVTGYEHFANAGSNAPKGSEPGAICPLWEDTGARHYEGQHSSSLYISA